MYREVTSSYYRWGLLDNFWLAFYHLDDIPNTKYQTKFDNNPRSTFGDYLCIYNPGRKTDGQTDLFLRTLGVMKGQENVKVHS